MLNKATILALVIGLIIMSWGLLGGEFEETSRVGSLICLECMGLGG